MLGKTIPATNRLAALGAGPLDIQRVDMGIGDVNDLDRIPTAGTRALDIGPRGGKFGFKRRHVRVGTEAEERDTEQVGGLGAELHLPDGLVDHRSLKANGALADFVILDLARNHPVSLNGPASSRPWRKEGREDGKQKREREEGAHIGQLANLLDDGSKNVLAQKS